MVVGDVQPSARCYIDDPVQIGRVYAGHGEEDEEGRNGIDIETDRSDKRY